MVPDAAVPAACALDSDSRVVPGEGEGGGGGQEGEREERWPSGQDGGAVGAEEEGAEEEGAEAAIQLLPAPTGQQRLGPSSGLAIAGGACLLTADLFLLFTSLLAHCPAPSAPGPGPGSPDTAHDSMAHDSMAHDSTPPAAAAAEAGPLARLVRLIYTAHVAQATLALYDAGGSPSGMDEDGAAPQPSRGGWG